MYADELFRDECDGSKDKQDGMKHFFRGPNTPEGGSIFDCRVYQRRASALVKSRVTGLQRWGRCALSVGNPRCSVGSVLWGLYWQWEVDLELGSDALVATFGRHKAHEIGQVFQLGL